jgi:ribonuclease Z
VILGTASQAPTRHRNQNGYVLRWDGQSILFDPGEGTQRQMILAGISPWPIRHICITHFHGDHCLGLPGVLQRMSLDGVTHAVDVLFPATGTGYFRKLRHASVFDDRIDVRPLPVAGNGIVTTDGPLSIVAVRLDHEPETFGWRIEEAPGRTMLPEDVSTHRTGQRMSFVMDTGICDAAVDLAADSDLMVCEATFAGEDEQLARRFRHLTAADAARIARDAGARRLVLTHFSQRYPDVRPLLDEAASIFPEVIAGEDLRRVPVPDRARPVGSPPP